MKRLAAALSLLLLTGCGLSLAHGVQEPGALPTEQVAGGGDIQVLPPGPRDDAPADEIVRDFFSAQSDPAASHASAREFLAPEERSSWRDSAGVSVFVNGLDVSPSEGAPGSFRVTGTLVGRIAADGSYSPATGRIDTLVRTRKGARGRSVITQVADGLLLSAADRNRSFRARSVYFLAPAATPGAAPSHLVPDQVFVPVSAESADALVRRLVAGPSRGLADSVQTAFPIGTVVRSVRTDPSGLVTVNLSQQVGKAAPLDREHMSAQLVWTLQGSTQFSKLRLLSAGKPVGVGSGGQVTTQDRGEWAVYDPDGLSTRVPLYYIGGRRLRVLDPTTEPAADASGRVTVDSAAASPRGGSLALIARGRKSDELSTGPTTGPFVVRATGTSLTSPSWGSGEQGLWFLQGGRVRLAPLDRAPVTVPVDSIEGLGPITAIRVSRDGARVALAVGGGARNRLLVGRIADRGGALRIVGLRGVADAVTDVRDLAWETATSIVVLGRLSQVTAPIRVAVDGSSVALVNKIGLEGSEPVGIAAAPKRPLVVAATSARAAVLFRDTNGQYSQERGIVGGQPFYPG